ncbi:hypothetical protein F7725_013981 [Dissostichus mawsoni]|uniref:Uncharacterized protein n=1 Tax=Dissostichus mawsoni TaxID=36200 RepID=A0A7J5YVT7_DISMA|nr:hypothetical protein F7725_013981 [Dissostichus mawsoni]
MPGQQAVRTNQGEEGGVKEPDGGLGHQEATAQQVEIIQRHQEACRSGGEGGLVFLRTSCSMTCRDLQDAPSREQQGVIEEPVGPPLALHHPLLEEYPFLGSIPIHGGLSELYHRRRMGRDLKKSLKMPLFGSTFSPKKIPPRKSASLSSLHTLDRSTREVELGLEYGPPVMNLGESGGNSSGREVQRLKKKNVQLEEENNLLKLKIEILLDMLTETTVEYHLIEKEVEDIKTQHRRKK